MNRTDAQSDHESTFQPSQISTPISRKEKPIPATITSTIAADDSMTSILSNLTTNQSSLLDANNQTSTLVPVNVVNPFHGASFVNGVIQLPQYQQILIKLPTIDILKMQAQQQQEQQQQQQSEMSVSNPIYPCDTQFIDDRVISRHSQYQQRLFQHLKTDLPVDVVSQFPLILTLIFIRLIEISFSDSLTDMRVSHAINVTF